MRKHILIVQGLFESDPNIYESYRCARDHFDTVIFSSWTGSVSDALSTWCSKMGFQVVTSEDPGSRLAYIDNGVKKFLNITRQILGCLSALNSDSIPPEAIVVRVRSDALLDFGRLKKAIHGYESVIDSQGILVTDVTTICPKYVPNPFPYLHICDWIYVGRKDTIEHLFKSFNLSEDDFFARLVPSRKGSDNIFSPLAAEQVLPFFEFSNEVRVSIEELYKSPESYIPEINVYLKRRFWILSSRELGLVSRKYLAFKSRHHRYPRLWFQRPPILKPFILVLHIISSWPINLGIWLLETLKLKKGLKSILVRILEKQKAR